MSDKKPPLTGKELQDKIRSGEMKITFAEQEEVELLRPYINRVLDAVGHPEAWVSDQSSIGDFRPIDFSSDNQSGDEYQKFVNDVAAILGIGINKGDYIVDIAMRLKALEPDG